MKTNVWYYMQGSDFPIVIARSDGHGVDVMEFQSWRELIGDGEAIERGEPFCREDSYHELTDLAADSDDNRKARQFVGMEAEEANKPLGLLALAVVRHQYGIGKTDSISGWLKDVLPKSMRTSRVLRKVTSELQSEQVDFRYLAREVKE
jgi:hypothetical protein